MLENLEDVIEALDMFTGDNSNGVLLALLFVDATTEEILNFQKEDVDKNKGTLKLTTNVGHKREIKVEEQWMIDFIAKVYENGFSVKNEDDIFNRLLEIKELWGKDNFKFLGIDM